MRALSFLLLLFLIACAPLKQVTLTDDQLKSNLERHMSTLGSKEYDGREAGTRGEELAMNYIAKQFKEVHLKPKGEKQFVQEFPFAEGAIVVKGTQLYINGKSFKLNEDYYPLEYSGNGVAIGYVARVDYGIDAPSQLYDNYIGKTNLNKKIFVIESGFPNKLGRNKDYGLEHRITTAVSRGAAAIVFINTDSIAEHPTPDFMHQHKAFSIPIIFAKGAAAKSLKNDVITNCAVGVEIQKIEKKAYNIIGYVNNKATYTVIIGAHYDAKSLSTIPAGADVNASGAAALIELARYYNGRKNQKNNYLFILFSGKEKFLIGSEYFIKHPTVDLKKVSYMINIDEIDRVKPENPFLFISGVGTSPSWKTAIDTSLTNGLKIRSAESTVNFSDEVPFYRDSIPVLNFSSWIRQEYSNETNVEGNVNYDGAIKIIHSIEQIIDKLNTKGKLQFTKTKNSP